MWKKVQVSLLVTLSALSAQSFARSSQAPQLLRPGIFHSNEVSAKTGDTWLGLFRTRHGYKLVNTRLIVTPPKNQLTDKNHEGYGCIVAVQQKVRPLFMVRNLPQLRPGPVPTVAAMKVLAFGAPVRLRLGPKVYTLDASKYVRKNKAVDYKIVLQCAKVSQTLVVRNNCDLGPQSYLPLLWAGDIDGDGKLDLLIDTTDSYNGWDPTLFLSRGAKSNQLVQLGPSFKQNGI